jgi:hypothetical protein
MLPPIADPPLDVQARIGIYRGAEMAAELTSDLRRGRLGDDVAGFAVDAPDGRVGKVQRINYTRTCMVVATGRWPFRRRLLIPASAVATVDPDRKVVYVRTKKRDVLSGPTYDEGAGVDEERATEAERYYAGYTEMHGRPVRVIRS